MIWSDTSCAKLAAEPMAECLSELSFGQRHLSCFCGLYDDTCTMLYISYNALPEPPPMKLQLKKIGNSTGLILPKELLARLGLKEGDELVVSETPGGLNITKGDETFQKGLEIARKAMKTYHNALKELAK